MIWNESFIYRVTGRREIHDILFVNILCLFRYVDGYLHEIGINYILIIKKTNRYIMLLLYSYIIDINYFY